jgi:hypothetical protein
VLSTPRLERELKLGQLAAGFPELSRVLSRTGPQHARLSERKRTELGPSGERLANGGSPHLPLTVT